MAKKSAYKLSFLYCALFLLTSLYHRAYYRRFRVIGREKIPAGKPVIFAANHQNALMDALAILFAVGKPIVFLARADIFRRKSIARLLRFIRILPVYRLRDGYSTLGQNQETFDEVNQVLKHNIPIALFPEGYHLGLKKLKPLRKGIARMAFQAEASADFKLDLQIIPVGLDYSDYFHAGSDLLVIFGEPIRVSNYKQQYLENQALAINCLRDDLASAMREIIIDIQDEDIHDDILEAADHYTQIELKKRKLKNTLWNRFQLNKKFISEFQISQKNDPLIINRLGVEMESEMASPAKNSRFHISKSQITRLIVIVILSPLYIYGLVVNFLPVRIAKIISQKIQDPHLRVSVKFGAGLFLYMIWYLLLAFIICICIHNPWVILALILMLPLSGLLVLHICSVGKMNH